MELYAWTIIAFRETAGGVSYGNYLFYSRTDSVAALISEIESKMDEKFPESEGWFERAYLIQGITTDYNNGSPSAGFKLPMYRLN